MKEILQKIKGGLIVSCQAEGDDPFNSPEGVSLFARAAEMGGACAIRSEGIEKTKKILESVKLPVIGLIKSKYDDGYVKITGSFKDVENLLKIGCHIIAIDGTFRKREGLRGPDFISEVKKKFDCIVMADCSNVEDLAACANSGADCVSSTLSGYTPETKHLPKDKPDYDLVIVGVKKINIPLIAEGRINSPEIAAKMLSFGAWAVVVGTAITRPRLVVMQYVEAMKKNI